MKEQERKDQKRRDYEEDGQDFKKSPAKTSLLGMPPVKVIKEMHTLKEKEKTLPRLLDLQVHPVPIKEP